MYLLKHATGAPTNSIIEFTFHYVSIKTMKILFFTLYLLHLHSTMYLLKRIPSCCIYTCICNLHSTMYLLKQEKPSLIIPDLKYLHSTMYLLKLLAYTLVLLLSRFTFHYVSIKHNHPAAEQRCYTIYIPLCIY